MFTVPLALFGALLGLWFFNQTLNIYSEIGLIMLVGLATKNGILIVEFIIQLRDEGLDFYNAIIEASKIRFRPIIMTSTTTIMGAIPLIYSFGAGAETRYVLGIVIFFGVLIMTFFTLFIIPVVYQLFAKNTSTPLAITHQLEQLLKEPPK
jgi:multidrug efflux pump